MDLNKENDNDILENINDLLILIKQTFSLCGNNIIIYDFLNKEYELIKNLNVIKKTVGDFNLKNRLTVDGLKNNTKYIYSLLED